MDDMQPPERFLPVPMEFWHNFNINHMVRVRLTDEGRRIYREWVLDLMCHTPGLGEPERYALMEVREDEDGWSVWQLWHLMEVFGKHLHIGFTGLPFKPDIQFDAREWW